MELWKNHCKKIQLLDLNPLTNDLVAVRFLLFFGSHDFTRTVVIPATALPLLRVRWRYKLEKIDDFFKEILLHGESTARNLDDRAAAEVVAEQSRVDGGTHQDHSQIWVRCHHVSKDDHNEVAVAVSERL